MCGCTVGKPGPRATQFPRWVGLWELADPEGPHENGLETASGYGPGWGWEDVQSESQDLARTLHDFRAPALKKL